MSGPVAFASQLAAVLALAIGCCGGAATAAPRGCGPEGMPGEGNAQQINRPTSDASRVAQSVTPASRGNLQSATTSSPDGSNLIVQAIDGDGNAQTAQQTGRNNVAVQSQAGACNHQSIRQSGGGNVAVQSQSGRVLQSASVQPGNGR